jgi:hypothetical protein
LPPAVSVQPLASSSRFIDRWLCRSDFVTYLTLSLSVRSGR